MSRILSARETLDRAMSEDELLTAVTDALTFGQWRWTHHRRSDKALLMGHKGVPDIIAVKRGRVLFIELKAHAGTVDADQLAWRLEMPPNSRAVTYLVLRPADLDGFLRDVLA